jgi:imidazolonepropionase-like amidohydrolase
VVQLDAWNWEDAAYKTDIGIHLNWPVMTIRKGWWAEPEGSEANKKYLEAVKKIDEFFAQAKAYHTQPSAEKNLKLEALRGVFSKTKKVFVHVSGAKEIMEVTAFKKTFNIDLVIVGGEESYQVADVLKENNIPVILSELHSLPGKPEDDIDLPYKLPLLLKQAGVEFCLSMGGSWQQRNLPFVAGTAAAYGLTKEEALAAITSSAAKILGLEKITGTIEAGKDANIIVSEGDVLDMRSSIIIYAFIQGRQIELDNHQTQLYRKFTDKYNNQ